MHYRPVPGTEMRLSEIGFGCGGNAGLMVRGEAAEQRQVIASALELGVNYFDTAPDYGDGVAEQALGRALRDLRAAPVITSKVEIRRQDLADVAGHVVRSAHDSLRRLGVERLDVLQIHNGPTAAPPAMEGGNYHELWIEHFLGAGGAMEGLRRLLDAGTIRYAGFVCRGNDGAQVRSLLATGLFRLINLPYTLLNPSAGMNWPAALPIERDYGDVLGAAHQAGCGAAVFSPLAGGYLAGPPQHRLARVRDPSSLFARRKQAQAAQFGFLAQACGGTLAQAAYRFVLSHPAVSTVVGGFSCVEQLAEAAAVSGSPPMPDAVMTAIEAVWHARPATALCD